MTSSVETLLPSLQNSPSSLSDFSHRSKFRTLKTFTYHVRAFLYPLLPHSTLASALLKQFPILDVGGCFVMSQLGKQVLFHVWWRGKLRQGPSQSTTVLCPAVAAVGTSFNPSVPNLTFTHQYE